VKRDIFTADHEAYRSAVRSYLEREITPNVERWEQERNVDRRAWKVAGQQGVIGMLVPEEHGGPGEPDFRYRYVVAEEFAFAGANSPAAGFALQDDIAIPYILEFGSAGQKSRWLPGMAAGELIGAIGMTEPGTGSDLQGIRTTAVLDGDHYVVNGSKTFITNGINADLAIVVCRTSPERGARALSLLVVESGTPGFSRGRKLAKLGLHAQDTGELFFDNVRVPAGNLLGAEGDGFAQLMHQLPRERLSIAIAGVAGARAAVNWTVAYTKERSAFGKPVASFQNTQFTLASAVTEVDVLEAYVDKAVLALNAGELSAVDAAKAKLWATDVQNRVINDCLQLFGGYGYMTEFPIARAWADARVSQIYGGTNEVMKLIIGRDLTGLR
jgi:long-chain-acyl-CoA dehydrogenase